VGVGVGVRVGVRVRVRVWVRVRVRVRVRVWVRDTEVCAVHALCRAVLRACHHGCVVPQARAVRLLCTSGRPGAMQGSAACMCPQSACVQQHGMDKLQPLRARSSNTARSQGLQQQQLQPGSSSSPTLRRRHAGLQ
jgi:hypothetical protein